MAAAEPSTGSPERSITLGEICSTLREIACEEESSFKAYGSQRGKRRSEVLDVTEKLIIGFMHDWDQLKEMRQRRLGGRR